MLIVSRFVAAGSGDGDRRSRVRVAHLSFQETTRSRSSRVSFLLPGRTHEDYYYEAFGSRPDDFTFCHKYPMF
jgi:hypothetical protein